MVAAWLWFSRRSSTRFQFAVAHTDQSLHHGRPRQNIWDRTFLSVRNGGADKNLDYLEVVHVFIRRQDPCGRALHQARQEDQGNDSATGLSDQGRAEGLVPG